MKILNLDQLIILAKYFGTVKYQNETKESIMKQLLYNVPPPTITSSKLNVGLTNQQIIDGFRNSQTIATRKDFINTLDRRGVFILANYFGLSNYKNQPRQDIIKQLLYNVPATPIVISKPAIPPSCNIAQAIGIDDYSSEKERKLIKSYMNANPPESKKKLLNSLSRDDLVILAQKLQIYNTKSFNDAQLREQIFSNKTGGMSPSQMFELAKNLEQRKSVLKYMEKRELMMIAKKYNIININKMPAENIKNKLYDLPYVGYSSPVCTSTGCQISEEMYPQSTGCQIDSDASSLVRAARLPPPIAAGDKIITPSQNMTLPPPLVPVVVPPPPAQPPSLIMPSVVMPQAQSPVRVMPAPQAQPPVRVMPAPQAQPPVRVMPAPQAQPPVRVMPTSQALAPVRVMPAPQAQPPVRVMPAPQAQPPVRVMPASQALALPWVMQIPRQPTIIRTSFTRSPVRIVELPQETPSNMSRASTRSNMTSSSGYETPAGSLERLRKTSGFRKFLEDHIEDEKRYNANLAYPSLVAISNLPDDDEIDGFSKLDDLLENIYIKYGQTRALSIKNKKIIKSTLDDFLAKNILRNESGKQMNTNSYSFLYNGVVLLEKTDNNNNNNYNTNNNNSTSMLNELKRMFTNVDWQRGVTGVIGNGLVLLSAYAFDMGLRQYIGDRSAGGYSSYPSFYNESSAICDDPFFIEKDQFCYPPTQAVGFPVQTDPSFFLPKPPTAVGFPM